RTSTPLTRQRERASTKQARPVTSWSPRTCAPPPKQFAGTSQLFWICSSWQEPGPTGSLVTTLALTLAILAVATTLVYVVIAIYIVPRIDLDRADPRVVVLVRGGAVAFFMGCAMTHLHMA